MSPPQPAGIPLSKALLILSQAHPTEFEAALRAIDSIHGCDLLAPIPILDADLPPGNGGNLEVNIYTQAPKKIFIDRATSFP